MKSNWDASKNILKVYTNSTFIRMYKTSWEFVGIITGLLQKLHGQTGGAIFWARARALGPQGPQFNL